MQNTSLGLEFLSHKISKAFSGLENNMERNPSLCMVHPGSPSNSRRGGGDDGEADRPCHCFVLTQHKEILRSDSDAWYSWKGKLDPPISTRFPSPGEDFSCYVPFQPDFISNAISIWSLLRGTLVLIMCSPSLSCTTTLHCAKSPTPLLSNKRCFPRPPVS